MKQVDVLDDHWKMFQKNKIKVVYQMCISSSQKIAYTDNVLLSTVF